MEYVALKNSDLQVSRLCMGGCPMGGYGWGDVVQKDLIEAVHTALDTGVNFFDTADTYGLGESEEILGKALMGKRENAVIASKFGVRVEKGKTFYDNSVAWINKSIEASLKRLNTGYIDLYQIHYRDERTSIDDVIEALEILRRKGYVRYFGLSNIHKKDIAELGSHVGEFVSFQEEYSLACRKNESDIFEIAQKLDLSSLTWGSLGQGILTGKYDVTSKFQPNDRRSRDIYVNFHGKKLEENLKIVEAMRNISAQNGKSVSSIAIRFILDYISDSVVLTGIKNKNQLLSNAEAMDWNLSNEDLGLLNAISRNGGLS